MIPILIPFPDAPVGEGSAPPVVAGMWGARLSRGSPTFMPELRRVHVPPGNPAVTEESASMSFAGQLPEKVFVEFLTIPESVVRINEGHYVSDEQLHRCAIKAAGGIE